MLSNKLIKTLYKILVGCICISHLCPAQSTTPWVINAAGKTATLATGGSYADNIGEVFIGIKSFSNQLFTEGFLQPEVQTNAGVFNVAFTPFITPLSCNKSDGKITLNVTTSGASVIYYVWSPASICPDSSCNSVANLKSGSYQVSVKAKFTRPAKPDTLVVVSSSLITIADNTNPCKITAYNAITFNNDNTNDFFFIENIEEFPENTVSIYNRYGVLIRTIEGYNNKDKIWPEKEQNNLTSGTYFYSIRLNEKEEPIKGWVELLKD